MTGKIDNRFGQFIGTSPIMLNLYDAIDKISATDAPVFITGETGTGKEICAQSIHDKSSRKGWPFVALNCAALPENLFESSLFGHVKGAFTGADQPRDGALKQAEGGTLFLDEICEMPPTLQAKLLRLTQDYTYQTLGSDKIKAADIRIICATNTQPHTQIERHRFREDLYYRLNQHPIETPPLRKRGGDIIDLAYFYLAQYNQEANRPPQRFETGAIRLMMNHDWPGNIRELQNIMRHIATHLNEHNHITSSMMPDNLQKSAFITSREKDDLNHISIPLWQIEKRAIEQAIHLCGGNISKAAALLQVAPSTIYRKKLNWDK